MLYYKIEPTSFLLPVTKSERYTYKHIFQFCGNCSAIPQQEYGFVHRDLVSRLGQLSYFLFDIFLVYS